MEENSENQSTDEKSLNVKSENRKPQESKGSFANVETTVVVEEMEEGQESLINQDKLFELENQTNKLLQDAPAVPIETQVEIKELNEVAIKLPPEKLPLKPLEVESVISKPPVSVNQVVSTPKINMSSQKISKSVNPMKIVSVKAIRPLSKPESSGPDDKASNILLVTQKILPSDVNNPPKSITPTKDSKPILIKSKDIVKATTQLDEIPVNVSTPITISTPTIKSIPNTVVLKCSEVRSFCENDNSETTKKDKEENKVNSLDLNNDNMQSIKEINENHTDVDLENSSKVEEKVLCENKILEENEKIPVNINQSESKLNAELIITNDNPETALASDEKIENIIENVSHNEQGQLEVVDKEESNDSQLDTYSESSEKDHNKSISRELKSLIKSAKESKIINECTQVTTKMRKSRCTLEGSNTSLDAEKIQGVRRSSNNSLISNSSGKSEKVPAKRSMRSQNPEFVSKVKHFLNSVTGRKDESSDDVSYSEPKLSSPVISSTPKRISDRQVKESKSKLKVDPYCWRCHYIAEQEDNNKTPPPVTCTICPRMYHFKCLQVPERTKASTDKSWVCPECLGELHAESSDTRSPAMKKLTLGMLCELLKYALTRMMELSSSEPFLNPVDRVQFPDYDKYVVHPMDLGQMMRNIDAKVYGSTEAFLADAQWILHNSIIFNTLQSKLTGGARALLRSCKAEVGEIEACPECYGAAHARRPTWFSDVCSTPHVLLWAKLKGFPYWPAKGMTVNSNGSVDVRFFGAHDRAWVPAKDCYLFSEKDPNNFRTKRQDIINSVQEAEQHIRNITRKFGSFVYPAYKTQFEPTKLAEQIRMMIPSYVGEIKPMNKDKNVSLTSPTIIISKSRSNSKCSKDSKNDGEMSDSEDKSEWATNQAGDSKSQENDTDKVSTMDVDTPDGRESVNVNTRKRRRSAMDEAVATVLDENISEPIDKRKRVENANNLKNNVSNTPSDKPNDKHNVEKGDKLIYKIKESKIDENIKVRDKRTTPKIKIILSKSRTPKIVLTSRPRTPKSSSKQNSPKQKALKRSKSYSRENERILVIDDTPKPKKSNKELNNSVIKSSSKSATEKSNEKKTSDNQKDDTNKSVTDSSKVLSNKQTDKKTKPYDDNTSLAAIARETAKKKSVDVDSSGNICNMSFPTISDVRSLSSNDSLPRSKSREISRANSDSGISSGSIVNNSKSGKDAAKKISTNTETSLVGKVGVRSFARMRSSTPEKEKAKRKGPIISNQIEVEIKTEPIDLDDEERQAEKMDLMNACQLRPVDHSTNLRNVRINKVVSGPSISKNKTGPVVRPRAKKSFPQPKRVEDGRSELNSKNSMVYIPIRPPSTNQVAAKNRASNIVNGPSPSTSGTRTSIANNTSKSQPSIVTVSSSSMSNSTVLSPSVVSTFMSSPKQTATNISMSTVGPIPTVGPPTNVHTVPLITSVNGQWTFSLQPVMSVGGVDNVANQPLVNGLSERLANNSGPISLFPGAILPQNASLLASNPNIAPNSGMLTNMGINRSTIIGSPQQANNSSAVLTRMSASDSSTPSELPRLQQRPLARNPLDATTPIASVPVPSNAGPLSAKLNQNAVKLADFFRNLLEDSIEKLDDPLSQVAALKIQIEQVQWRHKQQIDELKHNRDLIIEETRLAFEKEKARALSEAHREAKMDLDAAVKHTKSRQWCANCSQEAQFYCCWNTSYCDYPCQKAHWSQHFSVCAQQRTDGAPNSSDSAQSRLQPDYVPKNAPTLTVGPKIINRQLANDQQKSPIIVVDDSSAKCVGSFKAGGANSQPPPMILNKQLSSSEDASKKVVTSGGYIIVGGPPAQGQVTAPTRRSHPVQYFT